MARAGRGSAKGAEFERSICKLLSLWITDKKRKDVFWRSAMSGGRATVARKRGEMLRQSGDITSVAPEGHALTDKLYFELKFYRDLDLRNFFVKQKGTLARFWLKTLREAASYEKDPILIVKQDRVPTLLLTRASVLDPHVIDTPSSRSTVNFVNSVCIVYHLDDILCMRYSRGAKRRIKIGAQNG